MASKLSHMKERYDEWARKVVNLNKDPDEDKYGAGWNRLGFHRPVGGYLYGFGLLIPSAIIGLLFLPFLQFTIYRFPEIRSFEAAAGALFGALYTILDLELQPAIDRFVPQYSVSDPKKAMHYVTFFVKYQMWSGLIQILFVALFMFLYIIPYTTLSYLAWFILFINIKQYPAILGTFQGIISSLQHGAKERLIVFMRASILEPITQLGGGLIGLYLGGKNPMFGQFYGLALGWAIGSYIDDFFTFGLGMYWLSKILDQYGIKMWEIYGQRVPPDVWKSALGYSFRLMPRTIFTSLMGFFGFVVNYTGLPGIMTYQGIIGEAGNLKKFVGWSSEIIGRSQPGYSEAYNNGKITLTKYYIAEGLKYNSLFFGILGTFNIIALPVIIDIALGVWLNPSWELIGTVVVWKIFLELHGPYDDVFRRMIYISNHPEINTILDIIGSPIGLFITWYLLFVVEFGWLTLLVAGFPWAIFTFIFRWVYCSKKVLNLDKAFWKDIAWSCFLAPAIGMVALGAYSILILQAFWPVVSAPFSGNLLLIPVAITLIILLAGAFFIYFPIVSYFGYWDARSLNTFRRAMALSGPSLWLIYPMFKLFDIFYRKSPFKKQSYVTMGDQADVELQELMQIRYKKFVDYVQEEEKNKNGSNETSTLDN
jgi:hypothetical protein